MVEIAGHTIDPAKISYISPVQVEPLGGLYYVRLFVDGHRVLIYYETEDMAILAQELMTRMPGLP